MITSVRRRFADLDDRADQERISLVPVAGPVPGLTVSQMQAVLARRKLRVLDLVQDCGCIADNTTPAVVAENRRIIQDAITAAAGNGLTLKVRGGISVDRSIWVETSNVAFEGVLNTGGAIGLLNWCDPALILGISRTPGGVSLTSGHFPDAFGKLDSSAAASAGVRFGYRTNANSHVADVFGLPSQGANNWGVQKLTIAFCYDSSTNGNAGIMFGMAMGGKAFPWYVQKNESFPQIYLFYRVPDGTSYGGTGYSVSIAGTGVAGVHRVVFQLDLVAGTCIAFLDGVQVAVTATIPPPGSTLIKNQICPFHINKQGSSAVNPISDYASTPVISQTYYGLFVGGEPLYRNDGVGQPIKRIDNGATPNDSYLFTDRLTPGGYFTMQIPDAVAAREHRSIDMMSGWGIGDFGVNGRAFVLSPEMGNPWNSLGGYLTSDISFGCGRPHFGQAVVMGNTLYPTFRRTTFGGYVGLGSWGSAANYTVILEDCFFASMGTGFYSYYAIVRGTGLRFGRGGRCPIRNFSGSLKLEDVFIEGNDTPECFVWTVGGQTHLVDFHSDFEVTGTPTICSFYNMTGSNFARAAIFSLDGFIWGISEPDSPLFILDGLDTGERSAQFFARRLYGFSIPDVYVEEHGVEWSGTLEAHEIQQGKTAVVHVGAGTSGVVLDIIDQHGNMMVRRNVAPPDSQISNGTVALWFDPTPGTGGLKWKGKDSAGSVITGSFPSSP